MEDRDTILVIEGGSRWQVPHDAESQAYMDRYTAAVDKVPGRCDTCALRPGTPANRSKLVALLITLCLRHPERHGDFMCHEEGHKDKPCRGFVNLRKDH